MSDSASTTAFNQLSIQGAVFATLNALFGMYFVLFVLAVWSTYRHSGKAYSQLRIITWILFFDLCVHYSVRAAVFSRDRSLKVPADALTAWNVPMMFVSSITTTLGGLVADGLLAWRLYVVYGYPRWALWLPAAGVIITAMVGLVSNFQLLAVYHSTALYVSRYDLLSMQLDMAWAWTMLAVNTVMTASIMGRIIYITKTTTADVFSNKKARQYSTILEAIIESALFTWMGLILYGVTNVAPEGHITTNSNIGTVMICVVPVFFGISQCLITVRLGLTGSTESGSVSVPSQIVNVGSSKGIVFAVQQTTTVDRDSGHPLGHSEDTLAAQSESGSSLDTGAETV